MLSESIHVAIERDDVPQRDVEREPLSEFEVDAVVDDLADALT